MEVQHVELDALQPSPYNPRKTFVGKAFDDLVASIAAKGILEPLLARPVNNHIEIVAGERRWRAARKAGLTHVPIIVQERSDNDAMECQVVENLMRADLTELEEANGFKIYLGDAVNDDRVKRVKELSEKTGAQPQYINRRVELLTLPEKILKMWEKGELSIAHLEQFMRIERPLQLLEEIEKHWHCMPTAVALQKHIDGQAPDLKLAKFDKKECSRCPASTKVQKNLFGDDFEADAVKCMDRECFRTKQTNWILKNKDQFTKGLVNRIEPTFDGYLGVYGPPKAKCKECEKLTCRVNVLTLKSEVGCTDAGCMHEMKGEPKDKPKVSKTPGMARERFYQDFMQNGTFTPEQYTVLVITELVTLDGRVRTFVKEKLGFPKETWTKGEDIFNKIKSRTDDENNALMDEIVRFIASHERFTEKVEIAKWVGADIETWRPDEWYLKRKTTSELLDMMKKLRKDPEMVQLLNTRGIALEELKKKDLIAFMLEFADRFEPPKEILKGG